MSFLDLCTVFCFSWILETFQPLLLNYFKPLLLHCCSSVFFFLFQVFVFQLCMLHTLKMSHGSWMFCCCFVFHFSFQSEKFLLTYFQARWFLRCVRSPDEPIKGILHFYYSVFISIFISIIMFFISIIFFWFFKNSHLSTYATHLFLHVVHFLSILKPLTYYLQLLQILGLIIPKYLPRWRLDFLFSLCFCFLAWLCYCWKLDMMYLEEKLRSICLPLL